MATDRTFYEWGKLVPASLAHLAGLPPNVGWHWQSVTLKEKERRLDGVMQPQTHGEALLFVEFQGYPDEELLLRWMEGILSYVRQKGIQTAWKSVVIYVRRKDVIHKSLKMGGASRDWQLQFRPKSIVLQNLKPKQILDLHDDGLIPLLPLSDVPSVKLGDYTKEWSKRLRESQQLTEDKKLALAGVLGAFLTHRLPRLTVTELEQWIGGIKMEDTVVGQTLLERGRHIGEENTLRDSLRMALQFHLGETLPEWIENALQELHDPEQMRKLLKQSFKIKNEKEARILFTG